MKSLLITAMLGSAPLLAAVNVQQPALEQQESSQSGPRFAEDRMIKRKISEIITTDLIPKGFTTVTFEVSDSKVTLRGSVNTLEERKKVAEQIRTVAGVSEVDNQMNSVEKEPPSTASDPSTIADKEQENKRNAIRSRYPQDQGKTQEDKSINDKIREKLSIWFIHMYNGVSLETTDGVVTLKGFVNRKEDIQKINDRIKKVDGIKDIINELKIKT